MSNTHNPPLLLTLKPSVRLKYFIGMVYLLAFVACLSNSLALIYKSALCLLLLINYRLAVKHLEKKQCTTIKYDQVCGWQLAENTNFVSVKILPSTVITIYALFLHLEIIANETHIPIISHKSRQTNRKAVFVMADTLSVDDYRNLIVKLKTTWETKASLTAS